MDNDDDNVAGGQPLGTGTSDNFNFDTGAKRKRLEGPITPANVDVSKINRKPSEVYDPTKQNKFGILADLEIENTPYSSKVTTHNNTVNATTNVTKNPPGSINKSFCPPIFLYNVNIKHLIQQLEAKSPKIFFKIKNVNKQKSKLYLSDVTVHTEMMTILKEKKIKSYTFTPKELKQISLVLRGLYHETDADEIKIALDALVPNVISKVSKFTTPFSTKKKLDTGLFLVSLLPGKKMGDLTHIKYLLSQTIVWEKPKKKDQEIQCRRCQHWGHIARNCNSDFNCVKCKDKHLPGECPRNQQENTKPCCVNCGKSGHPANWRGCTSYKNYVDNKTDRMRKAQEEKSKVANNVKKCFPSSSTSPDRTFASLFHSKSTPQPSLQENKPSIVEEFLKLAEFFLEPEELTLEQELMKFIKEYKNKSKSEGKLEFMRLLSKVKSIHGP